MSTRLVVEIAAVGTKPDIQVYEDDIKKLEVPSLGLIRWSPSGVDDQQFNGENLVRSKVEVEIKEKNGTITLATKDGLVKMMFGAQIFFESLLAKFDENSYSLFDTEYGRDILKKIKEEYIRKSFYENGKLYCDSDFTFTGIGVVKSADETLMVARTIAFAEDGYIMVDGLLGPVNLQDIVSPKITFFPGGEKKILIDGINKVTNSTNPEKANNLCWMRGDVHIMEKNEPDIPLDTSLEDEAFEEAALQYISSQRRKTRANFDDLILD